MLADSECYCEDTYLLDAADCAVTCVRGDEMLALRHCDVRSRSGRLFQADDMETEISIEPTALIYTKMCVTDEVSETELRRYPWHSSEVEATGAQALVHVSSSKSVASLDGAGAYTLVSAAEGGASRKRVRAN